MQNDEKFAHIIKRHRPKGWRVYHSILRNKRAEEARQRSDDDTVLHDIAFAQPNTKVIRVPYVIDTFTLHILLHEYGHVHMKHWSSGAATLHRQEFESERWAAEIMRIEGVPVSDDIKRGIRRYIRHCITKDLEAGLQIEPHVARFVRVKIVEAT